MAPFGTPLYSREELTAEMGAGFLCAILGIENTFDQSAAYIQGWLKKLQDDRRLLVQASAQAQKAVEYLIRGWGPGQAFLPGNREDA